MEDKTSVDLVLGLVAGIDREHSDYLPLSVGSFILGGNFSARLMATVRDEEGLTYGIRSVVSGADEGKDGFWAIQGTFAPTMLEQGKTSTLNQLNLWLERGVTAEELAAKKTTLTGTYKVGLATTRGMAGALLDVLERGRGISYLDEYMDEVKALTLEDVNAAIRAYVRAENLITVAAGSMDDQWQPLEGE